MMILTSVSGLWAMGKRLLGKMKMKWVRTLTTRYSTNVSMLFSAVSVLISYIQAKDTFTIRVIPKKKIVEYAKNKKVFHVSTLPKDKLPLWALQAFHPINGGQLLIQNSNWLYKF